MFVRVTNEPFGIIEASEFIILQSRCSSVAQRKCQNIKGTLVGKQLSRIGGEHLPYFFSLSMQC